MTRGDSPCPCHWDWSEYASAFPRGITPSDLDAIVEIRGSFLVVECKQEGQQVPRGQLLLLWALAASSRVTAYVLYGKRNAPVAMWLVVPGEQPDPSPCSQAQVLELFRAWAAAAELEAVA